MKATSVKHFNFALEQVLFDDSDFALKKELKRGHYYCLEISKDRQHLLVDPINGSPYVYSAGGQMQVFKPGAGSGTDKLRARIHCHKLFEEMEKSAKRDRALGEPSPSPAM